MHGGSICFETFLLTLGVVWTLFGDDNNNNEQRLKREQTTPTMERAGVDPNSYPHSHSANDLSKTQDQLGNDGYENRQTAVANHTVPLGGAEEEEEGDEGVPSCLWDECGQKFPTLRKLVDHLSEWHIGWKKSAYTCQWNGCSRKGINQTSRFALISHLRGHTGERPFDCPVPECDKVRFEPVPLLHGRTFVGMS